MLRSDNPEREDFDATAATIPIATLVEQFRPEDLGPSVGTRLDAEALRTMFGFEEPPRTGRHGGHLFVVLGDGAELVAPDRARCVVSDLGPGETAFVLAPEANANWRYCGVGRRAQDEGMWSIPEVDFDTWRASSSSREASRRLPTGAEERARALVDQVLSTVGDGAWITARGQRCRVVGRSARGGLRIDGGPDGFRERTVSLLDLAWVLVAEDDVRERGGVLDEARVNRLRYLDGTPKGSTRWVDTGWGLVVVEAMR